MTESFLAGMKDLFEAHYVTIPEEKYDVISVEFQFLYKWSLCIFLIQKIVVKFKCLCIRSVVHGVCVFS